MDIYLYTKLVYKGMDGKLIKNYRCSFKSVSNLHFWIVSNIKK